MDFLEENGPTVAAVGAAATLAANPGLTMTASSGAPQGTSLEKVLLLISK